MSTLEINVSLTKEKFEQFYEVEISEDEWENICNSKLPQYLHEFIKELATGKKSGEKLLNT